MANIDERWQELFTGDIEDKVDAVDSVVDSIESKTDIIDTNLDDLKIVVGEKTDHVGVPYVSGIDTLMAYLQTGYYHIHGDSFLYPDKADPVQLTSSAASWSETGAIVEIIPSGSITKAFDLHWCSVWDISTTLYGVIDIFAGEPGAEERIGAVDVGRTANFSREMAMPAMIPQQPAGTRISCRFSDNTTSSRTVNIKFYGHTYG